ncbi:hypothetical protein [Curtobacterium sp. MCBA15_004]|uniref:hypothetical protein n=1 Tax=Curtobacterium sp. MCBA15_004 TaxID=1898733 RepID=UPI0015877B6B|nr:hypothetical protein [Curtobacterium sp. MCBA15_004]WIA95780.1 hypothetical protein QOL16_11740 [Curtobacterium sp. MCBA15_004]
MTAPIPELTSNDLILLERIVAERVDKEKAKQRWGRVPKKYDDLLRKLNRMLGKELA